MQTWISEMITPQLSASNGAGTRATHMLGSNMAMNASAEMLHPPQTSSWMKISVIPTAVETEAWHVEGFGEWMSIWRVPPGDMAGEAKVLNNIIYFVQK